MSNGLRRWWLTVFAVLALLFGISRIASAGGPAEFVYALTDVASGANQIYGFRVNANTGALTPLPGFPIATGGTGSGVTPSEYLYYDQTTARLYALNAGDITLSAFTVNRITGALAHLPFSPISLTGHHTLGCVAVHPRGSPVLVADAFNGVVTSLNVTHTTAIPASGSPYAGTNAFSCTVSRGGHYGGNYFYAGGQGHNFAGFAVDAASGTLTPLANSPYTTFGGDFPVGYATDGSARLFLANSSNGVPGSPYAAVRVATTSFGVPTDRDVESTGDLSQVVDAVLHWAGFYMVVDRVSNRIGVYRITGAGGYSTLAAVDGSPFATGGSGASALALSPNGDLLFSAHANSRNMTVFRVNASTGALAPLSTQAVDTIGASGNITGLAVVPARVVRADADGDGESDLIVVRASMPSSFRWYFRYSSVNFAEAPWGDLQWGLPGDTPLSGDFDGDGSIELAVYRPSNGVWYICYSSSEFSTDTYREFQWGLSGDIPMAADFDGDGVTDLAVYRPSNGVWYIRYSSRGYDMATHDEFQWGLSNDVPVAADFDGDGKAELAVYRPSNGTWYFRFSSLDYSTALSQEYQWGLPGDVPLITEFDNDGRAELTVYRPSNGTWYIRYSIHGYAVELAQAHQWGLSGDVPVIGDFDGDGRTEISVYRPSNGYWFIRFSSTQYHPATPGTYQWGLPGDEPIP